MASTSAKGSKRDAACAVNDDDDDDDDVTPNSRFTVAVRIRPKLEAVAEEKFDFVCVARDEPLQSRLAGHDTGSAGAERPAEPRPPAAVTIVDDELPYGGGGGLRGHSFTFDEVFDDCDSQDVVYDRLVRRHLRGTLDHGSDLSIIALGQTGSGKTYSMLGGKGLSAAGGSLSKDAGIFSRLLEDIAIFRAEQAASGFDVAVALTAIELYNDSVYDILSATKAPIAFRETRDDLLLTNPTVVDATNAAELEIALRAAERNRVVSSTAMNDVSSRSHALFFFDVFRRIVRSSGAQGQLAAVPTLSAEYARVKGERWTTAHQGGASNQFSASNVLFGVLRSRFAIVDLAGNERVKRSGVLGNQLQEALSVNKSLSAFGTVVHALVSGAAFVPFRDSKLTRLLRPALVSPLSRTAVLVTVSPVSSNVAESIMSLRFAHRLKELPMSVAAVPSRFLATREADAALLQAQRRLADLAAEARIVRDGFETSGLPLCRAPGPTRHATAAALGLRLRLCTESISSAVADASARHQRCIGVAAGPWLDEAQLWLVETWRKLQQDGQSLKKATDEVGGPIPRRHRAFETRAVEQMKMLLSRTAHEQHAVKSIIATSLADLAASRNANASLSESLAEAERNAVAAAGAGCCDATKSLAARHRDVTQLIAAETSEDECLAMELQRRDDVTRDLDKQLLVARSALEALVAGWQRESTMLASPLIRDVQQWQDTAIGVLIHRYMHVLGGDGAIAALTATDDWGRPPIAGSGPKEEELVDFGLATPRTSAAPNTDACAAPNSDAAELAARAPSSEDTPPDHVLVIPGDWSPPLPLLALAVNASTENRIYPETCGLELGQCFRIAGLRSVEVPGDIDDGVGGGSAVLHLKAASALAETFADLQENGMGLSRAPSTAVEAAVTSMVEQHRVERSRIRVAVPH